MIVSPGSTGVAFAMVAGPIRTAGPVTGAIFNPFASNANAFAVQAGKSSLFLFCSQDGVISGWNQV